ncbi:MAG: diacylglycerol kinase family protein [Candidatus Eisenbacteria bacterium]
MKDLGTTEILKSLEHKQEQHAALLKKVEKTAARLDRRKVKLRALESTIADLERRMAGPRKLRGGGKGPVAKRLRRAQLIFNPASGREEEKNAIRLSQIVCGLRTHGIEAAIGLKTSGKAARALARDAVRDEIPLVIVAAGDGTIGDVASQLVGTSTVMGLVPVGTMNNVARSLGIPLDIDAACALIGMGTSRHIDVGRVHASLSKHDEYFLECAGIGLSAIAALGGQAYEKRRWRVLPRAIRRFFDSKLGEMRIQLDDTEIQASTRLVTVSNAPLMANNMLGAPEAKMDDGFLDVSVYDGMGDTALISHFMAAASHKPDDLKSYRARRVRITTEHPEPAHADMAIAAGNTVLEIEVLAGALTMIVGNGIGLTIPVEAAPNAPTFATDPPIEDGVNDEAKPEPAAEQG